MDCPTCASGATGVVLTRQLLDLDGGGTLRRHACRQCRHRWYSHQVPPVVVDEAAIRWVDTMARLQRR